MPASSSIASGVPRTTRSSHLPRRWLSSARSCRHSAAALLVACALAAPAHADAQRDPELKSVVQRAIVTAECFPDKYDSAVWYTLMEPKLRRVVKDRDERMQILKTAFCEAHRPGELRLPPGLVMALMEIE